MIRPARRDDVGYIAELWLELVEYHRQLDPALPVPAHDGDERYARSIHNHIDASDVAVFVAVDNNGRIVGYVYGFIAGLLPDTFVQERAGMLADIYVQLAYRRRGYGQQLYHAIMNWFESQNVRSVEWDVAARNVQGRAFWQKMGGREILVRMTIPIEGSETHGYD